MFLISILFFNVDFSTITNIQQFRRTLKAVLHDNFRSKIDVLIKSALFCYDE